MKKQLKFALFLLILWGAIITALAQKNTYDYSFKKGEVIDILLLTNGPKVAALFPKYRKTAFPVASKFSFQSLPGFSIGTTLAGGVQPESMILGRWASKEKREGFLQAIVPAVPDFHEQRRALWTYFTLTYYELPEDTDFTIDRSKYTVVTSLWGAGEDFANYRSQFTKAVANYNGKEILTLTNGNSPAGYQYNPDYLTITQWESKEAFNHYAKNYQILEEKHITNVHQFVLD